MRGLLVTLMSIIGLTGCSYRHKQWPVAPTDGEPYTLRVIQADDFGSMWDRAAAAETLDAIEKAAAKENVVVVLFIHGWHHNAHLEDGNLRDFKDTLRELSTSLDATYSNREDKLKVLGIYVGWRGRSLPGLLDYITIWGRKPSAERVGEGDLSEFIARLQKTYRRQWDPARNKNQNFLGLVVAGHSLGSQVLFKSVAPLLEAALVEHTVPFAGTDFGVLIASREAAPPPPVEGIGDLVVLVNPALEAYQFERFSRLYKQRTYGPDQVPVLLTISSENDSARGFWFPLSRWFSLPFRPSFRNQKQAELYKYALGDYAGHVTHNLEADPDGSPADSVVNAAQGCAGDTDLSGTVRAGGAILRPTGEAAPIPNSPVIVAHTARAIVDGHNGVFDPPFRKFLADYITKIELKKIGQFECRVRQVSK